LFQSIENLSQLREQGMRWLALFMLLNAIVLGAAALAVGQIGLAIASLLLCIPSIAAAYSGAASVPHRIAVGVALPLYAAIACAVAAGSMWQMDMHMVFFVYLAVLSILADWRVIVAAALTTAVHHLVLNALMPDLVFMHGSDFARVALHAMLVVIASAALISLCRQISGLITGINKARAEQAELEAETGKKLEERLTGQASTIEALTSGLKELADGNFSYRIETIQDEPTDRAKLRSAFNGSIEQLASTIGDVRESAERVNTGSEEIRAASDDLANRNERQASELAEATTSMRDVTNLVRKTASNAESAQDAIAHTHRRARDGGEVVNRAVEAMGSIEKSSQEITQIIDVIDGIAFQTNLLALNAGVEAARAGDAGKGFAVVANEVRALAQRSAEAARDIKELIATSTGRVDEGVALVGETGELLETIVDQVGTVTAQIEDIATLAKTQAGNLEQVNATVESMDQMTQRNAAMVEQSTAAARSLSDESNRLEQLVSQFRTSNERVGQTSPTHRAHREPELISAKPAAPAQKQTPQKSTAQKSTAKKSTAQKPTSQKPAPQEPAPKPVAGNLALKPEEAAQFDDQDWSEF